MRQSRTEVQFRKAMESKENEWKTKRRNEKWYFSMKQNLKGSKKYGKSVIIRRSATLKIKARYRNRETIQRRIVFQASKFV